MGNRGIWGNRVQGYGVQDTWAMGTGVWAYGAIGYRGIGYRTYGPHGKWVQEYGGILGHVYSLTPP